MAAGRIYLVPFMPARDRNGRLVAGAKIAVYENRTTTLASVFTDATLTTPLANPVVANSAGQFPSIWTTDAELYTVAVSGPNGESIGNPSTFDDFSVSAPSAAAYAALLSELGLLGSGLTFSDTATGGETTVTAAQDVVAPWQVELFRNGVRQIPVIDFDADGTDVLTLTDAAEAGDEFVGIHTGGSIAYSPIRGIVTPEMYGALGDGTTDDLEAWQAALATSKIVQGDPTKTYLLSDELDITSAKIRDAKFKDARATTNRKTLKATECAFVMLKNVTVDWGADGSAGTLDNAAAIQLTDVAEVDLDVTVTGYGKGAGVRLNGCSGTLKAYIHDVTAGTSALARPSDDVFEGIHLISCENLSVYPRWDRLGTVWTGQASPAWAYTRGLAISGGDGIDVFAPRGTYTDQHIDISGDLNPGRITVHGGSVSYGRYFGCKIANTGSRITINNLRVYRVGLTGFVVSSTNDAAVPEADQPFDVRFVDCLAEEVGYDQVGYAYGGSALSNAMGFKCEVGDEYLTWPRGVVFIRPRVIGGGLTHYAFSDQTSEYEDPGSPGTKLAGNAGPFRNRIEDWKAADCVTQDEPTGFLTGRSVVSMTAPFSVPNGGSPTVFTFNQEPDNGMILIRTSAGSAVATDEVGVRYAGRFSVTATVLYAASGTGDRRCEIGVNGSLSGVYRVDQRASASLETTVRLTTILTLEAGDTLSVAGLQDSGGALNASATLEITDLKHQTGEVW